jgi:subtilisin-like proprotein convertase family protein
VRPQLKPLALSAIMISVLALSAAPAGAKTKTQTFSSGGPAVGSSGAVSEMHLAGKGNVKDVNVGVRVDHSFDGQLRIL